MDYLQYTRKAIRELRTQIRVLNLIINGLPSIHDKEAKRILKDMDTVLNLIINGLPSILYIKNTK